tara:strand:- start:5661 stop:5801 length:141 start_codon:yes stop_codon:yes gene_type:complete
MKKLSKFLILLFTVSIFVTSCREQTTGEKVEDAVEDVADDVEDAVE